MYAVHRPHLPRAAAIGMIAAVLAIMATLILASAVSDLRATPPGSSGTSWSAPAGQHLTVAPTWNVKPFAPLLRSPVVGPWTQHSPFPAG